MSTIKLGAPRPAATNYRRRESDQPQLPAIDLLPGEFRCESVTPGTHSVSFSSSGHEHGIGSGMDPARGTVTCEVCKLAQEQAAAQVDVRHITVEISAEVYLALKRASGGKTVEAYVSDVLSSAAKR